MGIQRSATHSKLGWMTPQAYASALRGETGLIGARLLRSRAQPYCHPRQSRLKSTQDSHYGWMKNGGHVSRSTNRLGNPKEPSVYHFRSADFTGQHLVTFL
jgi:hypothetical protein